MDIEEENYFTKVLEFSREESPISSLYCFKLLYFFVFSSVDIMKTKLDAENLGIVTLNSFLEEFYPGESTPEVPTQFILYHYNGLGRSSHDRKVMIYILWSRKRSLMIVFNVMQLFF